MGENNLQDKNNKNEHIITKQKKSFLVVTIIVSIWSLVVFILAIICFSLNEKISGIFSLSVFIPMLIMTIWFICTYKKRTNNDWIRSYVKTKGFLLSVESLELLKQTSEGIEHSFCLTKEIDIITGGLTLSKLLIDNQNKKFIYQKGKIYSKSYKFSDLINYEVYENGKSQVQGRVGAALVGGAFFGIGGLIVGSSMHRNINDKCNELKLIMHINDFECPEIVITFVNNVYWDKESWTYKNMKKNIQTVCSTLEYIMNQKTLEQSIQTQNEENVINKKSNKEQLQELKEMLDDGLITEEDFERKKKQILGL